MSFKCQQMSANYKNPHKCIAEDMENRKTCKI